MVGSSVARRTSGWQTTVAATAFLYAGKLASTGAPSRSKKLLVYSLRVRHWPQAAPKYTASYQRRARISVGPVCRPMAYIGSVHSGVR